MSLLDDVSIVVTPNGYKAGELYAVIPVPTEGAEEVTDGDFLLTGTQAQNTTGTYWITGTGWTISGGAANASATTATLVHIGSLGTVANVRYLISMDVTVISGTVRVRNSSGWVETEISSSNTYNYYAILGSSSTLVIEGISSFTGSINSISVKEYTSADMDVTRGTDATRVNESGLIEDVLANVPRIDYTGGGCPHILAEPERRNLALNSETFSSYNTSNVNISSSSILSPDGTSTAIKLALDNGTLSSNGGMSFTYSSTVGETLSWSMFVKKAEYRYLTFSFGSGSAVGFHFDLDTGLITQDLTNAQYTLIENKIESFNNGWYRISVSFIDLTGSGSRFVSVKPSPVEPTATNNNYSSTGDGTSGVYVWGAQLEEGSYATSYIPTSGSTVTRNQDIFTRDGIGSLINSTEGVLFVEIAALSDDGTDKRITLGDGTISNRIIIGYNAQDKIQIFFAGTSGSFTPDYVIDITQYAKIAVSWSSTKAKFYVNGSPVLETLGDFSFAADTLTELLFDNGTGAFSFFGKVKQLQVYDTSLSDTQLAALTS